MIAFTNHALDHMLCSVLDADITKKIVRLGRRTSDERIANYSIETLQMAQNHSRLDRTFNSKRDLKKVQEEITGLMAKVAKVGIENDSAEIMKYLSTFHPEHHEYLFHPPKWLPNIRIFTDDNEEGAGEWQRAGKHKSNAEDKSNYAFWKECTDLAFIDQVMTGAYLRSNPVSDDIYSVQNAFSALTVDDMEDDQEAGSDPDLDDLDEPSDGSDVEESWKDAQYRTMPTDRDDVAEDPFSSLPPISSTSQVPLDADIPLQPGDFQDMDAFFISLGFDHVPSIPSTDRPLEELLDIVGDVWGMSKSERQRVHKFWVGETRNELSQSFVSEFERLRKLHDQKLEEVNEISEEVWPELSI